MARDHCSDDQLIAYLDGELPGEERRKVARHLELCWQCRPRVAEMEEQIRRIRRVFADTDAALEGGGSGRERLLARCRAIEEKPSKEMKGSGSRTWRWAAWALVATSALAFASITTWITVRHAEPAPAARAPGPSRPAPQQMEATPARPRAPREVEAQPAAIAVPPDLEALEVEARFVLHRLRWDIEDPPEIRQQDGEVILRGVWTAEQVEQLKEALSAVREPELVRIETSLAERVAAAPTVYVEPPRISPPPRPFERELLERAGSPSLLVSTGNAAVAASERVMDLAWALRRLETRYTPAARHQIAPRVLWLISVIQSDYLTDLREEAGRLHRGLPPLRLPDQAAPSQQGLFENAQALRDLVQWLFAGRSLPASPATLAEAEEALARHLGGIDTQVHAQLASLRP